MLPAVACEMATIPIVLYRAESQWVRRTDGLCLRGVLRAGAAMVRVERRLGMGQQQLATSACC